MGSSDVESSWKSVGLLWDTWVSTSKASQAGLSAECAVGDDGGVKAFCCSWNHVLSLWQLPQVQPDVGVRCCDHATFGTSSIALQAALKQSICAHIQVEAEGVVIVSSVVSATDVHSPQSLSSEAQLQQGQRLNNVPYPRSSSEETCLSSGINAFIICNSHDMSVISTTASPDAITTQSTRTGQHSPDSSATEFEVQSFRATSPVTSSAAGGAHFAVSCRDGVHQLPLRSPQSADLCLIARPVLNEAWQ